MQFVQVDCLQPSRDSFGYLQVLPFAKVYVYDWVTNAPVQLYDSNDVAITNPVTADANGVAGFAAADNVYKIVITSADGAFTSTLQKVQLFDESSFTSFSATVAAAVIGPGSSTDGNFMQFDGTTGALAKGGLSLDTDGTLTANSDSKVPSQKAVKTALGALLNANDVEQYKGALNCSANPNYPAAESGYVYRVSVAGRIGGASGPRVEVGDRLECVTDGSAAGNHATVGANWWIVQANLDGAVIGPASATDGDIVFFDGTTGKLIKGNGNTLVSTLKLPAGSASAPACALNTNYGLYYDTTNTAVGVSVAGTELGYFNSSGYTQSVAGGGSSNIVLRSEASVAFAAQRFSPGISAASLTMDKARGSIASPAIPNNGDLLGTLAFRGWSSAPFNFTVGASIAGALIESGTPSATAMGSRVQFYACPIGSATLTEVLRYDTATGLSMYGANSVIDADRAFRPRSTTLSGAVTPAAAGRIFFHSDAQNGQGEFAVDTGTAYRHVGQSGLTRLTSDADATYTPRSDGRIVRDVATLSVDRKLVLAATNVTVGYEVRLSRRGSSGGFNRKVYQADGTTLIASIADNANADFIYDTAVSLWFQR